MSESVSPTPQSDAEEQGERIQPIVTRREFIAGAGAGVVVTAAVAGGVAVATRPSGQPVTPPTVVQPAPGGPAVVAPPVVPAPGQAQAPAVAKPATQAQPTIPQKGVLPLTQRAVTLEIDGIKHELVVDTRETLWETLVYQLGTANTNLGCDRAQCGACGVLVDGKAMNSCSILSWRLGRGQKITTVAGLVKGPGIEGLHPVQKAFWQEGGFQCGICTRGFIISTVALLEVNKSPTDEQIAQALSGNICRCSEYPKMYASVHKAAAEMRGESVTYAAPVPMLQRAAPAPAAAAAAPPAARTVEFEFQKALVDADDILPIRDNLRVMDGVLDVAGGETRVNIRFDPTKVDEARLKARLAELGHAVK